MIAVTLGTIPYPFNRVIDWLKLLLDQGMITEPVFLQHGITDVKILSDYEHVTSIPLVPSDELAEKLQAARFVISHAGRLMTCELASQDKSFIVLPRLFEQGEHVDNHQLIFSREVEQLGVSVCTTLNDFKKSVKSPPKPLRKQLFEGPTLSDFLIQKYPSVSVN